MRWLLHSFRRVLWIGRAKDFFFIDVHVGSYVIKQMRPNKEAVFIPLQAEITAIDHQFRTLINTALHQAKDVLFRRRCDNRAVIHIIPAVYGPTFSFSMRGTKASIKRSAVSSPTGTATEIAIQRSPAAP